MTREERRSLAYHRALVARLEAEPDAVLARARAHLARLAELHPHCRGLLQSWGEWLDRDLSALVELMLAEDQRACDLRQLSPFAGVLDARERAAVLRRFQAAERP